MEFKVGDRVKIRRGNYCFCSRCDHFVNSYQGKILTVTRTNKPGGHNFPVYVKLEPIDTLYGKSEWSFHINNMELVKIGQLTFDWYKP